MVSDPARAVLTDRHWLREIAGFLDDLPGLLLAFQPQTPRPRLAALVGLAIDAQDLRVLETLDRLAREPHYARDVSFDGAEEAAARRGRLASLQWLLERRSLAAHGHAPQLLDAVAEGSGEVSIVAWLAETRPDCVRVATTSTLNKAATNGHLAMLTWLHESKSVAAAFAPSVMDCAAARGHLDVVSFLVANRREGCTAQAAVAAARDAHSAVLRLLFDHYAEVFASTPEVLDSAGGGTESDRLDNVRFLHEVCRAPCTTAAVDNAAAAGNQDVVEYLLDHRTEGFSSSAVTSAASAGRLQLVCRLLRQWTSSPHGEELNLVPAITAASQQGHLDIVHVLLAVPASDQHPWNVASALRAASARGYTAIVRALVQRGRWLSLLDATCQAAYYGHDEVVALLKDAHQERQQQQAKHSVKAV